MWLKHLQQKHSKVIYLCGSLWQVMRHGVTFCCLSEMRLEAPHFTLTKGIKSQASISKVMLVAFYDIEWPLHLDLKSCNVAVTEDYYLQILQKLWMKIKNKCRHKVNDGIILLHGHVCSHVAHRIWDHLNAMQWDMHCVQSRLIAMQFSCFGLLKEAPKAIYSHQAEMHRRVQYRCSCSSPRNCLQTGYVDLCISGIPVKMPVIIVSNCFSVLACEHPPASFSCTSCY
jgi:Transposase.